jgi:predicted nucleic acid-binding protein
VSYLLDINVLSEVVKKRPAPRVLEWFASIQDEALYLSVLTLGEIRRGVERLPQGKGREELRSWLEIELPGWFGERVLPIDQKVADCWGTLLASTERTLPSIDALLAATARCHDLRIVTRNEKDFQGTGVAVLNPWEG